MADLFHDKAAEWDQRPIPAQISEGVFRALREAVDFSGGLRVMDFGAGTGLVCSKIAPLVDRVLAVDISEAMLEQLAKKPPGRPGRPKQQQGEISWTHRH